MSARRPDPLTRQARALIRREGWRVHAEPEPDGVRVVARVSGGELLGPALLMMWEEQHRLITAGIEAASVIRSEHVATVIARLPPSRAGVASFESALIEPLPSGTLAELLGAREDLTLGEAVTVLLGIADGLAAVHAAGFGGGRPGPGDIAFREDGCPVIRMLDGVRPLDGRSAVDDAAAFRELARALCPSLAERSAYEKTSLLTAVERALLSVDWRDSRAGVAGEPWERVTAALLAVAQPARVGIPKEPREEPVVGARYAPRLLEVLDDRPLGRLRSVIVERVRRRPRLLAAALVPVVAALALVVSLPGGEREPATPAASAPSETTAPLSSLSGSPRSTGDGVPADPAQGDRRTGGDRASSGARGAADAPSAADDPVTAAGALLERRRACFERAREPVGPGCLDSVLALGTPLAEAEADSLERGGGAARRDYTGASVTLTDRWADAALVSVAPDRKRTPDSEPASLLLVRSEAGWRIRAVFP